MGAVMVLWAAVRIPYDPVADHDGFSVQGFGIHGNVPGVEPKPLANAFVAESSRKVKGVDC